jgi:multimeric flavodoxin WrbA/putative sterol carrier protein
VKNMAPDPKKILFITSFVPVAVFKTIARMGQSDLTQARIATVLGFVLALGQYLLSRSYLKHTTYLEKAFLGFLGIGLAWVYITPTQWSSFFVGHSTTLLYLLLLLTTLIPQLAGYDPFTYAIAKQWYPETVWKAPQFRTINLHITYLWSFLFLLCLLSSWLGQGKPLFSVVLPLVFILGVGLPFSRLYPANYLRRKFKQPAVHPSLFPDTARELIERMPLGFDPKAGLGLKATIQFILTGEGGGEMALSISEGRCTFVEGRTKAPMLTIHSAGETWLKIARGEIDRPRALMEGLFRVEGDMNLLMMMGELFHPPSESIQKDPTEEVAAKKGGEKSMKILAVQGSPRPKASNTEVLLKEFLKGAESQGAETETIYLKEKEIHPCIGCYTCWTKTPGVCVFKDDMPEILDKVCSSHILVYATPLYNFNMTAYLKTFQERLLPLLDPHLIKTGDTYRHPLRYDIDMRMVLISNCGFPESSHFDGLCHVFHHIEESTGRPLIGRLLMPAGEFLKQKGMREKVKPVLEAAFQAGVEVVRDGRVSKETEAQIQKPVVSLEDMAEMANLWWDGYLQGVTRGKATEARIEDMRLLLKGMAVNFNPHAAGSLKAAIQFEVSGKQPGSWFLSIADGKCDCTEGKAASPTLTIRTPSEVWLAIANNELDGQEAFMNGKYTAQGEIGLLMKMKTLFGAGK